MNEEQLKIELGTLGTLEQCGEYSDGSYGISLKINIEDEDTQDAFDVAVNKYLISDFPIVDIRIMGSGTIKAIYKK